jgi:CubicO group peptidase (beta-lactamase class C family)
MKRILLGAFVAAMLAGGVMAEPARPLPSPDRFLFWTPAEQLVGYRNIETIFPTRVVRRGPAVAALARDARPFDVAYSQDGARMDVARFMERNRVSGLIVVRHGRILLERYGLGRKPADRWTSFSVAKSITSTLIGGGRPLQRGRRSG